MSRVVLNQGHVNHNHGALTTRPRCRLLTSLSLNNDLFFQPRPSSDKIAAIAKKLDLKKNVVRVWFCNQRQKQKRMKFSAFNGSPQEMINGVQ